MKTSSSTDPRLTVQFPPDLYDKLSQTAKANDRPLGAEVRVALRRHLDEQPKAAA